LPYHLKYRVLPQTLAICQLPPDLSLPPWALEGNFFSVTRTAHELSIVCDETRVPESIRTERNWVALEIAGPFPFSMTGVLDSFIKPLADQSIPIFAISTFDTDYVLLNRDQLEYALQALDQAGHRRLSQDQPSKAMK
jgi:hypothetical protein